MRSFAATIALIGTVIAPPPIYAQRKDCKETKNPKQLPTASTLLDSARAINDLVPFTSPSGSLLFSLAFLEGDSLPLVRPIAVSDSAAVAILAASVRSQKPSELWAVRVRVVQSPSPALLIERSTYCPPALIEGSSPMTLTSFEERAGDHPPASATARGRIRIRIETLVSADGMAETVNLVQGSGYRELDDQLVLHWRQMKFHPALLDGFPVEAWYKTDGQSPRP